MHYENQFDVASGKYNLKVVFASGGESFGKVEMPLVVDPYDAKQFSMSGVALEQGGAAGLRLGDGAGCSVAGRSRAADRQGMQLVPYGSNHFKKTDLVAFYMEIYEPLLVTADPTRPPVVAFELRVLEVRPGRKRKIPD